MTIFQITAISIFSLLIILSLLKLFRGRGRKRLVFFWLLLWCTAIVAVIHPDSLTSVAKLIGIERGADLVFYCGILGGLFGFFMTYLRFRKLNRQLTQMVRQIAINSAQQKTDLPPEIPSQSDT